ncbi:MAG: prolipoprotein diacylglyceryl transferase [Deltaproteobacteria bacterium]|nr:prolipoprotein diacylglyceryl transferase [Deltaproteobacteria bacterium]
MHPVLFNIPVQKLAPYLAQPVIFILAGLAFFISFRQGRARGEDSNHAVNGAILPTVVVLAVAELAAKSSSPWPLHTYGVLIALAFIIGIGLGVREARRTGFDEEAVLDMGFWALLSGMVGARVYFIAVNWKEYFVTKPWVKVEALPFEIPAVLAVWQGGLVFYGGAIAAVATFFWFARKRGLPVGRFADILIPSLPLGHALGRMGCFAAGCCWGDAAFHFDAGTLVVDFPFGAQFPKDSLAYGSLLQTVPLEVRDLMIRGGHTLPLYPTQWMEAFGETLIFGVLLWVRSRKVFHGQVAATYFLLYPLLRASLEFWRGDAERGYIIDRVLSVGQFTSVLVAVGALIVMIRLIQKNRMAAPAAA